MYLLNRIKFLILFLLLSILNVNAIVSPTKEFYVNDYANILSSETEKYIIDKSSQLANVDGTQIVVVTVNNLDGDTIENYANTLFRNFGIGDKTKNNGLLLLLALEERQFRVEVGYGLEGILPDGKTGRFQDTYIIPYLKNNKWDEGIKNGYDAFSTTLLVSPYQQHDVIKELAEQLAKKYEIDFVYRDFRVGFREGQAKARELGLYMQKYCGCVFSEEDRYSKQIKRDKEK